MNKVARFGVGVMLWIFLFPAIVMAVIVAVFGFAALMLSNLLMDVNGEVVEARRKREEAKRREDCDEGGDLHGDRGDESGTGGHLLH